MISEMYVHFAPPKHAEYIGAVYSYSADFWRSIFVRPELLYVHVSIDPCAHQALESFWDTLLEVSAYSENMHASLEKLTLELTSSITAPNYNNAVSSTLADGFALAGAMFRKRGVSLHPYISIQELNIPIELLGNVGSVFEIEDDEIERIPSSLDPVMQKHFQVLATCNGLRLLFPNLVAGTAELLENIPASAEEVLEHDQKIRAAIGSDGT